VELLEFPDPLVARYLKAEGLLEPAMRTVSEAALYLDYCLQVEVALLRVLARGGLFAPGLADDAAQAARKVTLADLEEEERRVHHDLKALLNVWSRHCPAPVRPFLHLGATSYDILSNAHLLRLRRGVHELALPHLRAVARQMARLAREEAATVQMGRTHGQHAEPLTFGYALAVYLDRLGAEILRLERALLELRGKFSGAVGSYNTMALLCADPRELERQVLSEVGLQPALASTQIAHPEPALQVLHHLVACFGVLANLADDLRHLQRTEIAEVAEAYHEESQVGSSAMPHKRNPITWESVKSLWKAFMPAMTTYYMDQISEHQRDLTNSATARFVPRLILGLAAAAARTARALGSLHVEREAMARRVAGSDFWLSGPLQTLLSAASVEGAHEAVRRCAVQARRQGLSLVEVVRRDPHLGPVLEQLEAARRLLEDPTSITAPAAARAREVAAFWEDRLRLGED
jgi:adenylosuccinate lyase